MTCQKVALAKCSKRLHVSEISAEFWKISGWELGARGPPDKPPKGQLEQTSRQMYVINEQRCSCFSQGTDGRKLAIWNEAASNRRCQTVQLLAHVTFLLIVQYHLPLLYSIRELGAPTSPLHAPAGFRLYFRTSQNTSLLGSLRKGSRNMAAGTRYMSLLEPSDCKVLEPSKFHSGNSGVNRQGKLS